MSSIGREGAIEEDEEDAGGEQVAEAGAGCELERVKVELQQTKARLDEARSEVAVAALLQENLLAMERQKVGLEDELATMQILLEEATQEGSQTGGSLDLMKRKYTELRGENKELRTQLAVVEERVAGRSAGEQGSDSLLGVTKHLARKVKSSVAGVTGAAAGDEDGRARAGAEQLREIVQPLEEQVSALKGRLREVDGLLGEYETRQGRGLLEMEAVADWLAGGDPAVIQSRLVAVVGDGYSGGAGELYHALLAARIGLLAVELSQARQEGGARQQQQAGLVGNRVISPGEWEQLQARLDREPGKDVAIQTEGEVSELGAELGRAQETCDKLREDLRAEAAFRRETEAAWNSRGEEYRAAVDSMADQVPFNGTDNSLLFYMPYEGAGRRSYSCGNPAGAPRPGGGHAAGPADPHERQGKGGVFGNVQTLCADPRPVVAGGAGAETIAGGER